MPQIVHVPPVRAPKLSGVDPKIRTRVLEFLSQFPEDPPADVLGRIAHEVMLSRFGYGPTEGKQLAVRALQALEQDGKVVIRYAEAKRKKAAPEVAQVRCIAEPAPVPRPLAAVPERIPPKRIRRDVPGFAPGVARERRRGEIKGDQNEMRFHALMVTLVRLLPVAFSDIIEADADRSGHHNPRKGKVDLRDHRGDDVHLRLLMKSPLEGSPRAKRLIYDVKSSYIRAKLFNGAIRLIGDQKKAALKRAIPVNHRRTDREIVGEVLDDITRVGLDTTAVRQSILEHFSA